MDGAFKWFRSVREESRRWAIADVLALAGQGTTPCGSMTTPQKINFGEMRSTYLQEQIQIITIAIGKPTNCAGRQINGLLKKKAAHDMNFPHLPQGHSRSGP